MCELRRGIEISLAECRSPAAAPVLYDRHYESERLQHCHRCNAYVRFVIAHEGVVPKNDFAALLFKNATRRRVYPLREPLVEPFTCVMGQRTSCGDSDCFLHRDARGLEPDKAIRQPRQHTAELA